jgi:Protein of unknown function (DUF2462)
MAQGLLKKPSTSKSKPSPHSSGITKKGSRTINPKNAKLQRQAKMNKKLTGGLTAQTERMLGEKAGHLEMIGKGRDKKGNGGGKEMAKGKAGEKGVGKRR